MEEQNDVPTSTFIVLFFPSLSIVQLQQKVMASLARSDGRHVECEDERSIPTIHSPFLFRNRAKISEKVCLPQLVKELLGVLN
uniref:Uncharacterized protein n=1 Tax=Solanum tuberosum TaxID=4113 RepID=M1ATW9_SOLTU